MINLKYAVVGLAALGGVALASGTASAMPNGMPAAAGQLSNVEKVVMVCNAWGRCWYRPNYYVGPRVYRLWLRRSALLWRRMGLSARLGTPLVIRQRSRV